MLAGIFLLFGFCASIGDLAAHGIDLNPPQQTFLLWVFVPIAAALALLAAYTLLATRPLWFIALALVTVYLFI